MLFGKRVRGLPFPVPPPHCADIWANEGQIPEGWPMPTRTAVPDHDCKENEEGAWLNTLRWKISVPLLLISPDRTLNTSSIKMFCLLWATCPCHAVNKLYSYHQYPQPTRFDRPTCKVGTLPLRLRRVREHIQGALGGKRFRKCEPFILLVIFSLQLKPLSYTGSS